MIKTMRVLLAAAGSRGDVGPLLALGSALCAREHKVVFCAPPNFESWVNAHHIPFRPVGRDVQSLLQSKAATVVSSPVRVLRDALQLLREETAAYMRVLLEESKGADLVVGTFSLIVGPSAAEACGTRYRCLICCPVLLPSRDHPPMFIPYRTLPGWINAPLWGVTACSINIAMRKIINNERRAVGLAAVQSVWDHCLTPDPILAADPILAPPPKGTRCRVTQTGPLALDETEKLDPDLEQFLSAGPPPVYVGFGSMPDPDPESSAAMLARIARSLGVRLLISSGWAGLKTSDQPTIRAVGETPHAKLFPRTLAVIHHGGAGTTATAARAGVPQIIVPHMLDQYYWGRRIEELGLGLAPVSRRSMNERALTEALRKCLEDSSLRNRTAEFAHQLRGDGIRQTIQELESDQARRQSFARQ